MKVASSLGAPWVITVDNFLTDAECDTLIRLGGDLGYQPSTKPGAKKFDGTYDAKFSVERTSTTAWCLDDCLNDPVSKAVNRKIENITGIPDANAEYWQLIK